MNETDKVKDIEYLYRAGAEAAAEGEAKRALHFIDQVLQLDPNHAKAWNVKGNCLDSLGNCEEALRSYDAAISLDPSNADILFNKSETLKKLGRDKEALLMEDEAVKMELGE